jgi:endonuclease V-like protein UPF0215 family
MPIHVDKKGIRALGISESFIKGFSQRSVLAGVVLRSDMILDGFSFSTTRVGGMDSTEKIIELYTAMERDDITILLLNGCVISWYNVVDLHYLNQELETPLICVTYETSDGLEKYFKEYFPDEWRSRVRIYHKNGRRIPLNLRTGHIIYVRFLGMSNIEASRILNKFTLHGAISEPLRIARLLARSLMRSYQIKNI